MIERAPSRSHLEVLSPVQLVRKFATEDKAERWFVSRRWPNGVRCAKCDSDNIQVRPTRKPQPYRCRACRKDFSVKTDTILHNSKAPLSSWAMAFYLYSTGLKGVSSTELHRDLGITQKSAWHMGHRIREAWETGADKFDGPVDVDETFVGGREEDKHKRKRLKPGGGSKGNAALIGATDRQTDRIAVMPVDSGDSATLQGFVHERTNPEALVFADEARAYDGLRRLHGRMKHSVKKFVKDMINTNGLESRWSLLKRGCIGVYHHFSGKHIDRYSNEFAGRHNACQIDTEAHTTDVVQGGVGKRVRFADPNVPIPARLLAMLNAWAFGGLHGTRI